MAAILGVGIAFVGCRAHGRKPIDSNKLYLSLDSAEIKIGFFLVFLKFLLTVVVNLTIFLSSFETISVIGVSKKILFFSYLFLTPAF